MSEPGLVLIHGGAHGAWCWDKVLPLLEHEVCVVDLPGRPNRPAALAELTLDDFADSVVADVNAAGLHRVVLVGHSMAGLTVPGVMDRLGERVVGVVLVSCLVPEPGGAAIDLVPQPLRGYLRRRFARAIDDPADPGLTIPRRLAKRLFYNDISASAARPYLDRLCADAPRVFFERATLPMARPGVPITWVRLARDKAVTPRTQDRLIARLGADVREIDSGHSPMINRPAEVAAILDESARKRSAP
jgi:pimeloyl-ACP methyl ester carboxylesterase